MTATLQRAIGWTALGAWLGAAGGWVPARGAADALPAGPPAEVRVDRSDLDRSNQARLTSYADVLEEVRHAVVSVYSTKTIPARPAGPAIDDPILRHFFGLDDEGRPERVERGLGSGVIVSSNGYILTNSHVIEGAESVSVALPDGRELEARIVGMDPRTDVAVLKIDDGGEPLRHATLADSDLIRVGDIVFAVGNPLGIGQTTTMGIISATGRSNLRLIDQGYEDFIQTDASINLGNSGGALVDAQGRVVGFNTAILSTSRGSIGIGFAIPVNLAANIMRSLIETGTVVRGFLGVSLRDLPSGPSAGGSANGGARGVVIIEVQPGSPAEKAGLKPGDILLQAGGRPISGSSDLRLTISQMAPGTATSVTVARGGENLVIDVTLGRLEDAAPAPVEVPDRLFEGIRVAALTPELRKQHELADDVNGVVVVEAAETSRFAHFLPVGTVIEQINTEKVTDPAGARAAVVRGRNVLIVRLKGETRFIPIVVD